MHSTNFAKPGVHNELHPRKSDQENECVLFRIAIGDPVFLNRVGNAGRASHKCYAGVWQVRRRQAGPDIVWKRDTGDWAWVWQSLFE